MISDLKAGQKFVDFFVLRHKELRTKRDSSETYLSVELGDASGRIFGSLWQDVEEMNTTLQSGQIVKVRGVVIDWRGKAHLSIDKIRSAVETDKVDIEQFLPRSRENPQELLIKLTAYIKEIDEPHLQQLVTGVFENPDITDRLLRTPAGKLWHHCYMGGLLQHTLSVVRHCISMAKEYENINVPLLIAGAMLHDIGKIIEYKTEGYFDYSDEGRLHGHVTIGYHMVATMIDQIKEFPETLRLELLHLILAHQGAREKGSPAPPMTREAFILNAADELDAKMGAFARIYQREFEPGKKWSNYVNLLDRFLYFGEKEE